MSIIHDALKKAANEKEQSKPQQPQPLEEGRRPKANDLQKSQLTKEPKPIHRKLPTPALTKEKQPKPTNKSFFIIPTIVALIIIIIAAFHLFPNNFSIKTIFPKQVNKTPSGATVIAPPITSNTEPVPKLETAKPIFSRFTLSGIAYEDTAPMAIINDSVYTVGDSVSGAKVVEITTEHVLLDKDGEKIVLKVQ